MVGDEILDTQEVCRLNPRLKVDWRQHRIKLARRQSLKVEGAVLTLFDDAEIVIRATRFECVIRVVGLRRLKCVEGLHCDGHRQST